MKESIDVRLYIIVSTGNIWIPKKPYCVSYFFAAGAEKTANAAIFFRYYTQLFSRVLTQYEKERKRIATRRQGLVTAPKSGRI